MEIYKVEMDFSKKIVFIHDKLVHTSIVQSDLGLARVPQITEIPAHSQMNIELKVTRRKSGDQVLLELIPSLNNINLAGAKCLVTVQKRKAVMNVINRTDESVFLPAHTVIATVSEANPDELNPFSEDFDTLN